MRRSAWKATVVATALALTVSGAAAAAPPTNVPGAAASASAGQSTGGSAGPSMGVGQKVAAAVQAALASGASGTALAEAVHAVILAEKPNAQGLTVAMAVYQAAYSSGSTGSNASPFSDLSQTPWGQSAIDSLAQAGVVNGTGSGQFSPDQDVTEAELATMLSRLQAGTAPAGQQAPSGTPSWAQGPMAWAEAGGILASEQGLTAPDAPLTRAQAVLMLINAAGLGNVAAQQSNATIALSGNVPAWAHGALALAIQLGLLQGSGGQLMANQPLTRAQMAVLLARLAVLEASATMSTTTTASGG